MTVVAQKQEINYFIGASKKDIADSLQKSSLCNFTEFNHNVFAAKNKIFDRNEFFTLYDNDSDIMLLARTLKNYNKNGALVGIELGVVSTAALDIFVGGYDKTNVKFYSHNGFLGEGAILLSLCLSHVSALAGAFIGGTIGLLTLPAAAVFKEKSAKKWINKTIAFTSHKMGTVGKNTVIIPLATFLNLGKFASATIKLSLATIFATAGTMLGFIGGSFKIILKKSKSILPKIWHWQNNLIVNKRSKVYCHEQCFHKSNQI